MPRRQSTVFPALILVILTLLYFAPAFRFEFVNYDDPQYILQNSRVAAGLSADNIAWAFRSLYYFNWHPITWLVYFATAQLFGLSPAAFHGVNIAIHSINAVLLFYLLLRTTGNLQHSLFVAALFAIHPQHVESVAWISELKDVLCALFMLLTVHVYVSYTRNKSLPKYLGVCACFALALGSKSMAVTLPALLLLIDFWPLNRITALGWKRLIVEKLPLMMMSIACALVTISAQSEARSDTSRYNLAVRLENAVSSYGQYLAKTFVPTNLAIYYPHPASLGQSTLTLTFAISLTTLCVITFFAIRSRNDKPYLLAGWLWFLGMLIPVIGLVQVGEQARADRYTYFPLIGIFIAVVWFVSEMKFGFIVSFGSAMLYFAMISFCAVTQIFTWRNTNILFAHAVKVTEKNYIAMDHLALDELSRGEIESASHWARLSIDANDRSPFGYAALARIYDARHQPDESIKCYKQAVSLDQSNPDFHNNLGSALATNNQLPLAEQEFREAIRLRPDLTKAHVNLGILLANTNRLGEAREQWRIALMIDPNDPVAHSALQQLGSLP